MRIRSGEVAFLGCGFNKRKYAGAAKICNENGLDFNIYRLGAKRIKRLLKNYKDRYLKDADNFPGGCVFITLYAKLNDQRPQLSTEIEKGFVGLKGMLRRFLEQGKNSGELLNSVDTDTVTEILFSGMLGACLAYGVNKSKKGLDI